MKALVYGAGVIGCYLAHVLCEAGQDVTLLARGRWREVLEGDGLVIRHSLQRRETTDRPQVIGGLRPQERYDAVFAVMQHQQMWEILPDLASVDAPLVVLVGNNMSAPAMEREILSRSVRPKTVLFGFQGTGGRREDGKVICVRFGDGSMSIGGLRGETPESAKETVRALFARTKYRLTWVADMDAWYHCHLTLILPAAYLCYATDCNLRRASHRQRKLLLDAAKEAYGLLKAIGYGIEPPGEDAYYERGPKRAAMSAMLLLMAKTVIGDLAASDHCRHAVTEMEGLHAAWAEMRSQKPELSMPAWDALRADMPGWDALHRRYGRG